MLSKTINKRPSFVGDGPSMPCARKEKSIMQMMQSLTGTLYEMKLLNLLLVFLEK